MPVQLMTNVKESQHYQSGTAHCGLCNSSGFSTCLCLIGKISLPCHGTSTTSRTDGTARAKSPRLRLSKTESRETSCVTVVLEFCCSQQRDSLSSSGRTLLNILVDDKVPSAALSPPLVFEEQRDSLRGLPGDCNNIFCAEAYEGCATNARAVSSRAALRDVVVRHARGRNDMRLNRLSDSKRNFFYTG